MWVSPLLVVRCCFYYSPSGVIIQSIHRCDKHQIPNVFLNLGYVGSVSCETLIHHFDMQWLIGIHRLVFLFHFKKSLDVHLHVCTDARHTAFCPLVPDGNRKAIGAHAAISPHQVLHCQLSSCIPSSILRSQHHWLLRCKPAVCKMLKGHYPSLLYNLKIAFDISSSPWWQRIMSLGTHGILKVLDYIEPTSKEWWEKFVIGMWDEW